MSYEVTDDDVQSVLGTEPWPEPTRLGDPPPAPIPLDGFPPVLRNHIRSVAESTQTPTDAAALLALAAISICVHGRAHVRVRTGWDEHLCAYVVLVLASGTRKSPVWSAMMSPIDEWEAEDARRMANDTARAIARHEVLEGAFRDAKSKASRGTASMDEVEAARIALEQHMIPRARRLIASDITPEALATRMLEQHGCLAIAAPEGDPLRIAAGRYSESPNLDVLKRAWSCEPIRVDRVKRPAEHIRRPSLVLAIAMQPEVLATISHARTLRGEGLYGRILWAIPMDGVGHRLTGDDVPDLDELAVAEYRQLMHTLLELEPAGEDEDGTLVHHEMWPDEAAIRVVRAFEAEVEKRLAPEGDLFDLRDWGGKLVGNMVRIAALLHVVECVDGGHDPWRTPIEAAAVEAAIGIARALSYHARAVLGTRSDDEMTVKVLERIVAIPAAERTARELFEHTRRQFRDMGELLEVLFRLEQANWVRMTPPAREGPGRKPSPKITLHPSLEFCVHPAYAELVLKYAQFNSADCANGSGGEKEV